jgi:hypothetical protein
LLFSRLVAMVNSSPSSSLRRMSHDLSQLLVPVAEHHFELRKSSSRPQECDECTSEIGYSKFDSIREL